MLVASKEGEIALWNDEESARAYVDKLLSSLPEGFSKLNDDEQIDFLAEKLLGDLYKEFKLYKSWASHHKAAMEALKNKSLLSEFLEDIKPEHIKDVFKDNPELCEKLLLYVNMNPQHEERRKILEILDYKEIVQLYERLHPVTYTTQKKAHEQYEDLSTIPDFIASITDTRYKFALTYFNKNKTTLAYVVLLDDAQNLKVEEDGSLTVNGVPVSLEDLQNPLARITANKEKYNKARDEIEQESGKRPHYVRPDDLEKIPDPHFLNVPFTVAWNDFQKTGELKRVFSVSVKELASKVLGSRAAGSDSRNALIERIKAFECLAGVLQTGSRISFYRIITFQEYDAENDVIQFTCPYLVKLIERLYEDNIKKKGKRKPNGLKETSAHVSTAQKMKLNKEKNAPAKRIVDIIVNVVEATGTKDPQNKKPHLTAQTILDYMPDFKARVFSQKTSSDKNKYLKRAFSRAFEILNEPLDRDGTTTAGLKEKYKDIKFPQPSDYPTLTTLNKVYTFSHKGKIEKSGV